MTSAEKPIRRDVFALYYGEIRQMFYCRDYSLHLLVPVTCTAVQIIYLPGIPISRKEPREFPEYPGIPGNRRELL